MNVQDSIYFHEDFYGQQELVPVQNLFSKRNEADVTTEKSEEAWTGNGFITAYVIEETKYPLDRLEISVTDFENISKEHALFHFRQVYTGYSSHRELKADTLAFGYENYSLFYEFSGNIITKAWIVYTSFSDTLRVYPQRLHSVLLKLGQVYGLILVDWNESQAIVLSNESVLARYINETL